MRKLLFAMLVAVVGCGSSGGGGGLSGTIGGKAFTPMGVEAVMAGPATCTGVPVLGTLEAQAFAIRFASYANFCADFADPFCTVHASAESLTVIFADLSETTQVPTGVAPGTYTVNPDPTVPVPQTSGPLVNTAVVTFAESVSTDATCEPTLTVAKGTLRIDSVSASATEIKGHVDLTLGTYNSGTQVFTANGDRFSGDFTAPVCTGQTISDEDLCGIAVEGPTCSGGGTCI